MFDSLEIKRAIICKSIIYSNSFFRFVINDIFQYIYLFLFLIKFLTRLMFLFHSLA